MVIKVPNHISYSLSWLAQTTKNFACNFKSGWTEWRSSCDAVLWHLLYPQQLFLKLHSKSEYKFFLCLKHFVVHKKCKYCKDKKYFGSLSEFVSQLEKEQWRLH